MTPALSLSLTPWTCSVWLLMADMIARAHCLQKNINILIKTGFNISVAVLEFLRGFLAAQRQIKRFSWIRCHWHSTASPGFRISKTLCQPSLVNSLSISNNGRTQCNSFVFRAALSTGCPNKTYTLDTISLFSDTFWIDTSAIVWGDEKGCGIAANVIYLPRRAWMWRKIN